ncbi:MAG: glycosyl transferase group 1 [Chloroflexi bacterium]|nr:glycosyl transferase group 1 [Chloroflexota bacterium]
MKIAMLHATLPSRWRGKEGGVTYFVHNLANKLVERGHQVTMFALDTRPDDALYAVRTINAARWLHTNRLARYYLTPILFARLKLQEFEAIHTHGDDWLMSTRKMRRVRTMHGSALAEARTSLSWKRRLNHLVLYQVERLAARRATRVVANSRDTIRYFPRIKQVIGCGVDTRAFQQNSLPKSKTPAILFVGTLEGRKRGRLLVEIFLSEIKPRLPEAELWLVAEKPVEGDGLVNFGKICQEQLIELYQKAWVFCLPSTYEGFGIPYVEALAAGTPVAATPNPGSCEILEDGRYGLICEPAKLGAGLLDLLQDAGSREAMAAQGRVRAAKYDWDAIAQAYEQLYAELATGN